MGASCRNACLQFLVPTLRDLPDDCWVIIEELRVRYLVLTQCSNILTRSTREQDPS